MNCPVCQRSLAPVLSICPGCGAMMNDSVREELELKLTSGRLVAKQRDAKASRESRPVRAGQQEPAQLVKKKTVTATLQSQKTSQTLVEFQNKNSAVPDWRIQLQNAVQQRKGSLVDSTFSDAPEHEVKRNSHGNLALKTEPVTPREAEVSQRIGDPRVANAIRRIEESRNTFFRAPAKTMKSASGTQTAPARPFGVVSPNGKSPTFVFGFPEVRPSQQRRPLLVKPSNNAADTRNTNKLPKIELPSESEIAIDKPALEIRNRSESASILLPFPESTRIQITAEHVDVRELDSALGEDDIEDLAPFSMRFGAGLFDFIIGGFSTMLLLSPLAFTSADWFTVGSFLTFLGTWALVMFVYMTACLGFFGKTLGMRLFQLELVDAVENEYPTLRQAAVNTSLFLVTVAFAGIPFLTVYFNEERRGLHDLLSGTILVREF